jgi:hypothetical protein
MGLREKLNEKPMLGWIVAAVAIVGAALFILRSTGSNAPDSVERRSQMVTIRDTETGDEWTMNRGQFERLLLLEHGRIDTNAGIPSKFSDGRPTGVLVDKKDWEETVERINKLKDALGAGG